MAAQCQISAIIDSPIRWRVASWHGVGIPGTAIDGVSREMMFGNNANGGVLDPDSGWNVFGRFGCVG